jgi:hypothetical protein
MSILSLCYFCNNLTMLYSSFMQLQCSMIIELLWSRSLMNEIRKKKKKKKKNLKLGWSPERRSAGTLGKGDVDRTS